MLLWLQIIGFVKVAKGALFHVAETVVEHVVRLRHALELLSGNAGGCMFWYHPLGNLGAFIRPSIGFTLAFLDLISVFIKQAALRGRHYGVCKTSGWDLAGNWGIQGSSSVSEIPKSLQICFSVGESASVQHKVGDIPGCGGAGCCNVAEHSICRVLSGHLGLTCVEIYNIFRWLDKIYYKFPYHGCPKGSLLIDRRVELALRALWLRTNSNRLLRSLLWFYRLLCSWTCEWWLTNTCSTVCCAL